MPHTGEVDEHIHPIIDEVRYAEMHADRRLVGPLSAEMEGLFVEAKRIEQFVVRQPETGSFLRSWAALRHNANTLAKPLLTKTHQRLESACYGRRLQKAI
jgi:hypothetical protein